MVGGGEIEILFPGEKATRYTIQISSDMTDWVSLEKIIIGKGESVREKFETSRGFEFFRVLKE